MNGITLMNTRSIKRLACRAFSSQSITHALLLSTILFATAFTTGCASNTTGSVSIQSQSNRGSSLASEFTTGFYRYDNKNQVTMLLFDGPIEAPTQAVTVRMFWNPRPGRTPMDKTATNATIHYIIFPTEDRKQVGIYSGAGFLHPKGTPGDLELKLKVWDSTLRLTDASPGFKDLLGPANLKGTITLKQDDVALERAIRQLNATIRETLGFPRMVEADITTDQLAAATN